MGGNNPMDFGKSQAKVQMTPDTGVTFSEVAGCDGAKLELMEVVDFLKKPEVSFSHSLERTHFHSFIFVLSCLSLSFISLTHSLTGPP